MTFMKQIAGEFDGKSSEKKEEPRDQIQAMGPDWVPEGLPSWVT